MDKDTEIAEVIDPYYICQVWQIQVGVQSHFLKQSCLASLQKGAHRDLFLQLSFREEAFCDQQGKTLLTQPHLVMVKPLRDPLAFTTSCVCSCDQLFRGLSAARNGREVN